MRGRVIGFILCLGSALIIALLGYHYQIAPELIACITMPLSAISAIFLVSAFLV